MRFALIKGPSSSSDAESGGESVGLFDDGGGDAAAEESKAEDVPDAAEGKKEKEFFEVRGILEFSFLFIFISDSETWESFCQFNTGLANSS